MQSIQIELNSRKERALSRREKMHGCCHSRGPAARGVYISTIGENKEKVAQLHTELLEATCWLGN